MMDHMSQSNGREALRRQLEAYIPFNAQEDADRALMLESLADAEGADILERTNLREHFTASAWVVNADRTKVLMVYHNIYDSWSWTGGHADGEADLLAVAVREVEEETGVKARPVSKEIFSIERLPVDGHFKRGAYVPSHMHLNVTYLLEADDSAPLKVKADENRAVAWLENEETLSKPSEAERWIVDSVYRKLLAKVAAKA